MPDVKMAVRLASLFVIVILFIAAAAVVVVVVIVGLRAQVVFWLAGGRC